MCNKKIKNDKLTLIKPTSLSDPYLEYGQKHLNEILNKDDEELNAIDFRTLLNGNLPAGTFAELAYYLPLSIDYLCDGNDDDMEMIYCWIEFIFENDKLINRKFNIKITEILSCIFNNLALKAICSCKDQRSDKISENNTSRLPNTENIDILCTIFNRVNIYPLGQKWIKDIVFELKTGTEIQRKWLYTLYEECNEIFGQYLDDETMIEVLDSLPETD